MSRFDEAITNKNCSQSCNQINFNFPINSSYSFNSMPWNIDYSSLVNPTYYAPPNYFYLPNSQFSGLDQIKSANQATRPNQSLEVNQVQKKQSIVQVQIEQKVKNGGSVSLKIQQKYGRNILSNIFQSTLKKILSPQFSQNIFKAIQRNKMSITLQQFKQRLQEKTKDIKGYINMKFIKSLKIGKPIGATRLDIQFRKLLRILCRIYNHNYHIPHIFYTSKIKKESRGLHLTCLRKLSKRNKK